MGEVIKFEDIESKLLMLNNQRVLIDRDVADLYGVETREVNQAVKNNPEKFPIGYIFQISGKDRNELVKNFDNRFSSLKSVPVMPTAFAEKGLYMLATILKSPRATETTIAIVETFAKIREFSKVISQLPNTHDEPQQKRLIARSGEILSDILDENTLEVTGDETTIELNLAVMKIKHTVKRGKRKD